MPRTLLKSLFVMSLLALSGMASSSALTDYNLILSGDFNVSGGSGHIEGKSFIGGSLQQGSIFSDGVKVVGDLNDVSIQVQNGSLDYQGANNMGSAGSLAVCGGRTCLNHVTDGSLSAEKTSIFSQLQAESDFYKGLAGSANTLITGDNNNKTLKYTGSATDLVIFNMTSTQFLSTNSWNLDFGTALNVLVNVSGSTIGGSIGQSGNLANDANASKVLWNFYEATTVSLQREWYGSILALNATVNTNSNVTGTLAAKSYIGNAEIHDGYWSYIPPVAKVPEPSALMLTLFGLGFIALVRIRSRQR